MGTIKKKIMIIGAGDFQTPLIEYASQSHSVVVVAPTVPIHIRRLACAVYNLDVRDQEKILSIARSEAIDGVITDQTDVAVRTVAYVAENMNLPGIGYECSLLFTNKGNMVHKLRELDIPVIPSLLTSSLSESVGFMKDLDCDVIIKPADSQGSRGVFLCHDPFELEAVFEKARAFSPSGMILAQKYIDGIEFFVEGLSFNGLFKNLIIGDTFYFSSNKTFSAKERIAPSSRSAALIDRIGKLNKKIIEGFSLTQGITHSEFIVSGDDIYLIETAARGGGVYISSDIVPISTGFNTEEFLTNICLGTQSGFPQISNRGIACGYMAFYLPVGEVVDASAVKAITELPFVHRNQLWKIKKGMVQDSEPSDKTSRYALIVSGNDLNALHDNMAEIRRKLDIKIMTQNGIRGLIWE